MNVRSVSGTIKWVFAIHMWEADEEAEEATNRRVSGSQEKIHPSLDMDHSAPVIAS